MTSDIERERAFVTALRHMKTRISLFTALPLSKLEKASVTAKVCKIGHADGASSPRQDVA